MPTLNSPLVSVASLSTRLVSLSFSSHFHFPISFENSLCLLFDFYMIIYFNIIYGILCLRSEFLDFSSDLWGFGILGNWFYTGLNAAFDCFCSISIECSQMYSLRKASFTYLTNILISTIYKYCLFRYDV